jgi:hypothetical protein
MDDHCRAFEFDVGMRVQLTPLGIGRCPRLKSHTGVIIGKSHLGKAYRVLLDGRKMPLALHEGYIETERDSATTRSAPTPSRSPRD